LNADQVQPLTKPVIDALGELYKKLKEVMLQLTKKLQQNYRSKKNIIHVTTVLRAF
jgi:hypothetical protein